VSTANTSGVAQLARLIWIMFGPMGLTVTALVIAGAVGTGWRTSADYIYFVLLALTIAARWVEFAGGGATSGTGEPVSRRDVVRYSITTLIIGLVAWVCANVIANHIL
jgi:hypothetical protein